MSQYFSPYNRVRPNRTEVTDNYTVNSGDDFVVFNIATDKLCTLEDPTTIGERVIVIINKYTSTAATEVSFSEDINNDSAFVLTPEQSVSLISNGTEYLIF